MSLDVPQSFAELWKITDQTNGDLRPEYLLPLLYMESTLSPSADNGQGFYGINQIDGATLKAKGIDPVVYKTWSASRQLRQVAGPYFVAQDQQYGPIRSGTRAYQCNFVPASLPLAHDFSDVICARGGKRYHGQEDAFYKANSANLDLNHKGAITVGDMAAAISRALAHPTVDAYIAAAYVFRGEPRPGVGKFIGGCFGPGSETTGVFVPDGVGALPPGLTPQNPVYGTDFDAQGRYVGGGKKSPPSTAVHQAPFPWAPVGAALGLMGAAWVAFWYMEAGGARKVRHMLEENPTSRRARSHVQSLLFSRREYTPAQAKRWAQDHGYRSGKVDVTEHHVRLRQASPDSFSRLRTVTFGQGIQAVVGFQ